MNKPKQPRAWHDGYLMTDGYMTGYRRGFARGQQLTKAISQHDYLAVTAISLLWITITILWTKFF